MHNLISRDVTAAKLSSNRNELLRESILQQQAQTIFSHEIILNWRKRERKRESERYSEQDEKHDRIFRKTTIERLAQAISIIVTTTTTILTSCYKELKHAINHQQHKSNAILGTTFSLLFFKKFKCNLIA